MYTLFIVVFVVLYCIFVLGYGGEDRKKYPHIYKIVDRGVIIFVVALVALNFLGYI